jgi:hypothetical protein
MTTKFATQSLIMGFAIDIEHLNGDPDLTADHLDDIAYTTATRFAFEMVPDAVETTDEYFVVLWNKAGTYTVHSAREFQDGFMADDGTPQCRVRVTVRKTYHWV